MHGQVLSLVYIYYYRDQFLTFFRTDTSKQPKELLEDNIKNFSFGLKALEEIQENIERELKHSKFVSKLKH